MKIYVDANSESKNKSPPPRQRAVIMANGRSKEMNEHLTRSKQSHKQGKEVTNIL